MNRYQDTTPIIQQKQEPTRYSDKQFLHTINAGVVLPLAQAFTTSIMVMILTAVIVYAMDGLDYLKPMLIAGALTFVIAWLALAGRWINLTQIERITRMDLNGDGVIGRKAAPEPRSLRVQIDNLQPNGHISQSQIIDFTGYATEEQLKDFADGILDQGKGLSEKEWSPIETGCPFSIDQYRKFRNELLRRGMIVAANSKSKNLGFVMTAVGKAMLRRIQDDPKMNPE